MEWIRIYVLPLMLILAGLWLIRVELQYVLRERRNHGRVLWIRLLRRLAGAGVMIAIAVMVHLGKLAPAGPEQARAQLNHWMWVMGLLLLTVALAMWDAVDGVRNLRRYFEDIEKEEVARISRHLARAAEAPEVDAN